MEVICICCGMHFSEGESEDEYFRNGCWNCGYNPNDDTDDERSVANPLNSSTNPDKQSPQ
jgi:predicted  nucleic acid-binding Zn-ribbon protein